MPFRNVAIRITNIALRGRVLKKKAIYIEFSKCSHLGLIEADEGNECLGLFSKAPPTIYFKCFKTNEISFALDATIFGLTV